MASRLVKGTAGYSVVGAVGIVNVVSPRLLVLEGWRYVIVGLPEIVGMVEESVRAHALKPVVQTLSVVKAALGEGAGIIEAGALARVGPGGEVPDPRDGERRGTDLIPCRRKNSPSLLNLVRALIPLPEPKRSTYHVKG